ncbi:hypothetical protein [Streptomyces sp. NPDC058385]|uniref:hypothetical protein n=1 Tax=Streptomyces sp. NPDC058385 TaxID=3346473 RepID=UPI00365D8211
MCLEQPGRFPRRRWRSTARSCRCFVRRRATVDHDADLALLTGSPTIADRGKTLEDHQYFFFNLEPPFPAGQSRIASYAHVLGNWTQEFAAHHRYGLCYVLRLHPEVTGTPGRIGLVRELITHIQAHPDVWVATGSQIADWWRTSHPTNDPGHPADLFARLRSGQGRAA